MDGLRALKSPQALSVGVSYLYSREYECLERVGTRLRQWEHQVASHNHSHLFLS